MKIHVRIQYIICRGLASAIEIWRLTSKETIQLTKGSSLEQPFKVSHYHGCTIQETGLTNTHEYTHIHLHVHSSPKGQQTFFIYMVIRDGETNDMLSISTPLSVLLNVSSNNSSPCEPFVISVSTSSFLLDAKFFSALFAVLAQCNSLIGH